MQIGDAKADGEKIFKTQQLESNKTKKHTLNMEMCFNSHKHIAARNRKVDQYHITSQVYSLYKESCFCRRSVVLILSECETFSIIT